MSVDERLFLEHLKAIRTDTGTRREGQKEIKYRLSQREGDQAAIRGRLAAMSDRRG